MLQGSSKSFQMFTELKISYIFLQVMGSLDLGCEFEKYQKDKGFYMRHLKCTGGNIKRRHESSLNQGVQAPAICFDSNTWKIKLLFFPKTTSALLTTSVW